MARENWWHLLKQKKNYNYLFVQFLKCYRGIVDTIQSSSSKQLFTSTKSKNHKAQINDIN